MSANFLRSVSQGSAREQQLFAGIAAAPGLTAINGESRDLSIRNQPAEPMDVLAQSYRQVLCKTGVNQAR
jgi:hypothetical protein